MSQGELYQVIFEESPKLFTGTFLQCINESRRRGVVKGLMQAQQIVAAYTNPEVLLKQEIDRLQQNLPQSKL